MKNILSHFGGHLPAEDDRIVKKSNCRVLYSAFREMETKRASKRTICDRTLNIDRAAFKKHPDDRERITGLSRLQTICDSEKVSV
jgi:hypothetical protein